MGKFYQINLRLDVAVLQKVYIRVFIALLSLQGSQRNQDTRLCIILDASLHPTYNLNKHICLHQNINVNTLESVAGSITQASGTLNLRMAWVRESSMEAAGTLLMAASSPVSIPNPPWSADQSLEWCCCHKDPCQNKFQLCQVLRLSSIELQLLGCQDRIGFRIPPLTQAVWSSNCLIEGVSTLKVISQVRDNPSLDLRIQGPPN